MNAPTSHYTVLARRFRPQSFDEVVGQEHVAQALLNAIQGGRVAHAYLFTGARGVGKTSTARILAKSLNCPYAKDAIPCNKCEICQGISAGNDVDVSEIDGASNRGIDDIRSLRANVNVKSMRTKYKVYIIDEVHMLTKEAFNALLKTLEEPPQNVKFVFCTTEPNKLPDTILSRCQRFDFGTIAPASIMGRLTQIAEAEGKIVAPEALELVARRAAGSMRDSQSLFDQLLAFGSEEITEQDVHRLLGTASDERLLALVAAMVEQDRAQLLEKFSAALDEGVQLGELVDQLLDVLRDVMVVEAGADAVLLLGVTESSRPALKSLAERWTLPTAVAAMQVLAETKSRMQWTTHGRTLAELGLIRITLLQDLNALDGLIEQLRSGQLKASAPAAPAASRPASPAPARRTQETRPSTPGAARTSEGGPPRSHGEDHQKKSPVTENVAALPTEAPQVAGPTLEFRTDNAKEILAQLVLSVDDMVRNSLKCVKNAAIFGPNRLDLTFPKRYAFQKQYCERQEVLSGLESIAESLTGRHVRVTFSLVDEEDEQPSEAPQRADALPKSPAGNQQVEPQDDPFVQQAIEVFGGAVEKVMAIAGAAAQKE